LSCISNKRLSPEGGRDDLGLSLDRGEIRIEAQSRVLTLLCDFSISLHRV